MSGCDTHVTESGTLAFRVALSVLRHREDAEDVAQEAVVRSLQRFHSLRDRTRFRSWLVRLTWRLALDRRRADGRRAARDVRWVAEESGQGTAEHDLILRERADRLWAAIDDLPPRLRLPLVLGTLEGHSLDDVASLLGVPVGTVKSRTFEARRKLRQKLISAGVVTSILALAVLAWPPTRLAPPTQATLVTHQQTPVASSTARIAPAAVSPIRRPSSPVPDDAPKSVSSGATTAFPGIVLPAVAMPTIEIRIIDTRVVHLPIVPVSIVGVPTIDIPVVGSLSAAGSPEVHSEKQR